MRLREYFRFPNKKFLIKLFLPIYFKKQQIEYFGSNVENYYIYCVYMLVYIYLYIYT